MTGAAQKLHPSIHWQDLNLVNAFPDRQCKLFQRWLPVSAVAELVGTLPEIVSSLLVCLEGDPGAR